MWGSFTTCSIHCIVAHRRLLAQTEILMLENGKYKSVGSVAVILVHSHVLYFPLITSSQWLQGLLCTCNSQSGSFSSLQTHYVVPFYGFTGSSSQSHGYRYCSAEKVWQSKNGTLQCCSNDSPQQRGVVIGGFDEASDLLCNGPEVYGSKSILMKLGTACNNEGYTYLSLEE